MDSKGFLYDSTFPYKRIIESKIACLWIVHKPMTFPDCTFCLNGFCTYKKYCNQKGIWNNEV